MSWRANDERRPRPPVGLAVGIAALVQTIGLAVALRSGRHGHVHLDQAALIAALLGLAAALMLLARRRAPGPTVAVVGALAAASLATSGTPPTAAVPLAIAVVSAIGSGARAWVWSTLAGVALVVPTLAALLDRSPDASVRPLVVVVALCFVVGLAELFRSRRERYRAAARARMEERRIAEEAERTRIARELHDVLAHSLSSISVQAGVGLHLFDTDPAQARASLEAIRGTSAQALGEVRGVLAFLRGEDEAERVPAPGLAELPALVASRRSPQTEIVLSGGRIGRALSPAVQLALYRIAQESITNAVRHGTPTRVTVGLRAENGGIRLRVEDDGGGAVPAPRDPESSPAGRGILGMRERAEQLGGSLSAASTSRGFAVEAWIPDTVPTLGRTE